MKLSGVERRILEDTTTLTRGRTALGYERTLVDTRRQQAAFCFRPRDGMGK